MINHINKVKEMIVQNLKDGEVFPELPDGIKLLHVRHCPELTSLPELPNGLEHLDIYDCTALTSLPKLPEGLDELYVRYCPALTSLPKLPDGLKMLRVWDCQEITSLPELPKELEHLDVPNNLQPQKMQIDDKSKMIDELCHRVKCLVNHTKIRLWSNTLGKKDTIKPYFNSLLDDLLIEIYENFARAKQDGKDGP